MTVRFVFEQEVIGAMLNLRYSLQCKIFWLNGDMLAVRLVSLNRVTDAVLNL